jgi:hypothetical protein
MVKVTASGEGFIANYLNVKKLHALQVLTVMAHE